jgi:hypothetical protein
MRSLKRPNHSNRTQPAPSGVDIAPECVEVSEESDEDTAYETHEMFRVVCPDCARPIALLPDEDVLPEHALCSTPWKPFGLTVCPGTGRRVGEAAPAGASPEVHEREMAVLLALPEGLNWRTQPFSHVGGPGSRPMQMRQQAA